MKKLADAISKLENNNASNSNLISMDSKDERQDDDLDEKTNIVIANKLISQSKLN